MQLVFGFLASVAGVYSIFILIRIITTWFSGRNGSVTSKPVDLLGKITDPYLDWWRQSLKLRFGVLDMSPIAGIAALSAAQSMLSSLSRAEIITLGNILSILLLSLWSVVSWVLGFCFIILLLRIFAHLTSRDMYSPFWKTIDSVTQPIILNINKIVFGSRLSDFIKILVLSSLVIIGLRIGGGIVISMVAGMFANLPF